MLMCASYMCIHVHVCAHASLRCVEVRGQYQVSTLITHLYWFGWGFLDIPSPRDPSVSALSALRLLTQAAIPSFLRVLGTWVRVLGLVQQAFNWLDAPSVLSGFLTDVLLVHTGYLAFNTGSNESYSLDLTEPRAHRLGRYIFSINFLREGNRF